MRDAAARVPGEARAAASRKIKGCRQCGATYEKPKGSGTPYCGTACRHAGEAHKAGRRAVWDMVSR